MGLPPIFMAAPLYLKDLVLYPFISYQYQMSKKGRRLHTINRSSIVCN